MSVKCLKKSCNGTRIISYRSCSFVNVHGEIAKVSLLDSECDVCHSAAINSTMHDKNISILSAAGFYDLPYAKRLYISEERV